MNPPRPRRPLRACAVVPMLCLALLTPTACTPHVTSPSGPSPTPSTGPSTIEHAVNSPDHISVVVPDGWIDNSQVTGPSPNDLVLTREAGSTRFQPGLFASRLSPRVLTNAEDGEPLSLDIWAYRDQQVADASTSAGIVSVVPLPDRTIDGLPAPGRRTVAEQDGTTSVYETWSVLRRDGVWEITVCGDPGADTVPPELLAALDTLRWSPPGDGTTPSPTP